MLLVASINIAAVLELGGSCLLFMKEPEGDISLAAFTGHHQNQSCLWASRETTSKARSPSGFPARGEMSGQPPHSVNQAGRNDGDLHACYQLMSAWRTRLAAAEGICKARC
jgi:hypothetical protein